MTIKGKHVLQAVLALCLSLLFFVSFSNVTTNDQTAYAADNSLQKVKEKGTLVVATSPDDRSKGDRTRRS